MKLAEAFETKTVGRFSKHALDYTNLKEFEVLRLREIGVMDKEEQGVSTLKFLSADDMGYEVEIAEKVVGKGWSTLTYKIPPMTLITSTTRVGMEKQFERRSWIFNPDESPEQTKRIREWKAKLKREEYDVAWGKREITSKGYSMLVVKAVVKKLRPCIVIVPYIGTLLSTLDTKILRVRGDFDKIMHACIATKKYF